MATSSNADIPETDNFFLIFCSERKDQSQNLSITEIINCETGSYLNLQKAIFHATPPRTSCKRVPNTAEISTEPISYQSSISFGKKEQENVGRSLIQVLRIVC